MRTGRKQNQLTLTSACLYKPQANKPLTSNRIRVQCSTGLCSRHGRTHTLRTVLLAETCYQLVGLHQAQACKRLLLFFLPIRFQSPAVSIANPCAWVRSSPESRATPAFAMFFFFFFQTKNAYPLPHTAPVSASKARTHEHT